MTKVSFWEKCPFKNKQGALDCAEGIVPNESFISGRLLNN